MNAAAARRPALFFLAATSSLIGLAAVVACFYPGYMSSDSVDQLGQARNGIYFPAHPPAMAFVWHWLDLAVPGPLGMLLLQNAMFWGG